MYRTFFCSLAAAMLLVSGAKAETGISWAKGGSGKTGYDAVPGKRVCRTVSEKDSNILIGAAYNGICHYYHYAEALKSRNFEYLLPPKEGVIRWTYPGPNLTSSGLTPIKTGAWNWACTADEKNIGYVWRNKAGLNKCYFYNGSKGAPEEQKKYKILAFGTRASHSAYRNSAAERYFNIYNERNGAFVRKNGPFYCKTSVLKLANGCDVPKNFQNLNVKVPDEVPGILVSIAEETMDGLFNDNDYEKFREACNAHDVCYRSPWFLAAGGKADCERQFETDLQQKCDDVHDDGSPNWAVCKITAASMAAAVTNHGGDSYDRGQVWSKDNCAYP